MNTQPIVESIETAISQLNALLLVVRSGAEPIKDSSETLTGKLSLKAKAHLAAMVVGYATGVDVSALLEHNRSDTIANARFVAFWLMRERTNASYSEIGRLFGNRDHASVMHGVRRVKERAETQPKYRAVIDKLSADFQKAIEQHNK